MQPFFSFPTRFAPDEIATVTALNGETDRGRLVEMYGGATPDPFGSGRTAGLLPKVSLDQLLEFAAAARLAGINFNYTLNGACLGGREFTKAGRRDLTRFMEKLEKGGITAITIAIPSLIEFAARNFPCFEVAASVILRIDSAAKARQVEDLGAKRIILFEDVSRNFAVIDQIRASCAAELELMANSPCTFGCLFREMHYNLVSHSHQDGCGDYDLWLARCSVMKYENPAETLRARGLIRPEDIATYTQRGVRYFKLVGRESDKANQAAIARAYLAGRFDGNMFELFARAAGTIPAFSLDNRQLDGFLDPFVAGKLSCTAGCHYCGYCDKFAEAIAIGIPPDRLKRDVANYKESVALRRETD